MHPIRKQRLQMVILIVVAASLVVGLIAYMIGQNANYFYTPAQIAAGEAPQSVNIRAGGMVVDGSVVRSPDSLDVRFTVTDGMATLDVQYGGILPDLFAEGEAAIASGKLDEYLVLQANEVLAKHDENYMPPEVTEALRQSGKLDQMMGAKNK